MYSLITEITSLIYCIIKPHLSSNKTGKHTYMYSTAGFNKGIQPFNSILQRYTLHLCVYVCVYTCLCVCVCAIMCAWVCFCWSFRLVQKIREDIVSLGTSFIWNRLGYRNSFVYWNRFEYCFIWKRFHFKDTKAISSSTQASISCSTPYCKSPYSSISYDRLQNSFSGSFHRPGIGTLCIWNRSRSYIQLDNSGICLFLVTQWQMISVVIVDVFLVT